MAGAGTWEDLPGRPVRAVHAGTTVYGPIIALLHATEDENVLDFTLLDRQHQEAMASSTRPAG